jgi:hypothetical protein
MSTFARCVPLTPTIPLTPASGVAATWRASPPSSGCCRSAPESAQASAIRAPCEGAESARPGNEKRMAARTDAGDRGAEPRALRGTTVLTSDCRNHDATALNWTARMMTPAMLTNRNTVLVRPVAFRAQDRSRPPDLPRPAAFLHPHPKLSSLPQCWHAPRPIVHTPASRPSSHACLQCPPMSFMP